MTDYIREKAEFPEKKYYIKLIKRRYDDECYLNYQRSFDEYSVYDPDEDDDEDYKTKFTMDEIKAIDERYLPFAVPVEEVDSDE